MKNFYRIIFIIAASLLSGTQAAAWTPEEVNGLQPIMNPEGEATSYRFFSMGYSNGDYYEDSALATSLIVTDNEVYIKNPLFDYTTNAWIKGTREGDIVKFEFPQTLGSYLRQSPDTYQYEYAPVYLFLCKAEEVTVDGPDGEDYSFWTLDIDEDSQTLEMKIADDGKITWGNPDPEYMSDLLGIGGFVAVGNELYWDKGAELYDEFAPLGISNAEPPASITKERWNYRDSYEYRLVDVAENGEEIWIRDADPAVKDGWLHGKLQDGKALFESGQYIGINDHFRRTSFFMGGERAMISTGDGDEYMGSKVLDSLTLLYDADSKSLSPESDSAEFIFIDKKMKASDFEDPETLYYHMMGLVTDPELYVYEDFGIQRPANPEITGYSTYEYIGWGSVNLTEVDFLFATPNVDVAGQTIDTELCWYNIFVNGELFSLWNDEFLKLPASLDGLSDIPYSFNEDYGLFTRSLLHELFLTSEGIETIGVKGFYQATEETILETDLVTLDLASGEITTQDDSAIRNLSAENAKITTTEYYNLQGQRIEHPRAGEIAVVRHIMSDGSVKTSKTIIK